MIAPYTAAYDRTAPTKESNSLSFSGILSVHSIKFLKDCIRQKTVFHDMILQTIPVPIFIEYDPKIFETIN